MVSFTGIAWAWAAWIIGLFAIRQFIEAHNREGAGRRFARPFAWFFTLLFVMSCLFTVSLWTTSPIFIKKCLLVGHVVLWADFAIIADILWQTNLHQRMSRWVPILAVLGLDAIQIVVESRDNMMPTIVSIGSRWVVVDWHMGLSALLLLIFMVWILASPMGVYFVEKAQALMPEKGKYKSLGMGLGFIITAVASALSPLHQPLVLLEIETLFLALGPTVLLVSVLVRAKRLKVT